METVLITGANRGLGLALTKRFAEAGWTVLAGCRKPDDASQLVALKDHGDVRLFSLDVTNGHDIEALVDQLGGEAIDVLINNAGVMESNPADIEGVTDDEWLQMFAINSIAPVRMALALKHNLKASSNPRVVTVSSEMGSLNQNKDGAMAYRSTKAAVNKAMQALATNFASEGVTVCPLHPGWVRTDMGGSSAAISPEESAEGIYELTCGLTPDMSGRFWTWDGSEHPW